MLHGTGIFADACIMILSHSCIGIYSSPMKRLEHTPPKINMLHVKTTELKKKLSESNLFFGSFSAKIPFY